MQLFNSKHKKAKAARDVSEIDTGKLNSPISSNKLWKKQSSKRRGSQRSSTSQVEEEEERQPTSPSSSNGSPPSCLVRHSNVGSSLKTQKKTGKKGRFFSASKKKKVHFAPIEVRPFTYDYSCDKDVHYGKDNIAVMNKERFKEASKLRKQRNIKLPSRQEREDAAKGKACDDADIAKRTSDLKKVIEEAFDPERDIDEELSIRGIEHFVYPALQQEMIRRKKQVQMEVLNCQKAKRLALLSESVTQWAREVAVEKGMRYCINQEAMYGTEECGISKAELARSKDELDELHMLKTSASWDE
ncbi:hypothetical protein QTG54_011754 [Skeletonema marinoi]|uniref:Uncharacterized protein n=1 Tax=Skeletonema marinoi TaxID=267567 RepID=A0AAD8Y106_9STRA|nr:hypothetical protein QTG54_011754 [Skeletonema marinoi]